MTRRTISLQTLTFPLQEERGVSPLYAAASMKSTSLSRVYVAVGDSIGVRQPFLLLYEVIVTHALHSMLH